MGNENWLSFNHVLSEILRDQTHKPMLQQIDIAVDIDADLAQIALNQQQRAY